MHLPARFFFEPNGTTTNRSTLMVTVREWPEKEAAPV